MANRKDPLHSYENVPQSVNGDFLLRKERDTVRSFVPPLHDSTEMAQNFAGSLHYSNPSDVNGEIHSYSDIDTLPPVQVLLRGMEEQDTPENRATVIHELRTHQDEIRHQMNTEIVASKLKYEQLAKSHTTPSRNRTASLIEEKIRRKSIALDNTVGPIGSTNPNLAYPLPHITKVPEEDKKVMEHFTSPGLILNQQEELLYNNKFDSSTVLQHDSSREFKQGFRRYFEAKREKEEKLAKVNTASNDLLKTNNLDFSFGGPNDISSTGGVGKLPKNSAQNQLTNPHENDRYNKPRVTTISIDSADRDTTLYPNANNFKVSLPQQFRNVKRIVTISSEFPNTDLIVRDDPSEAILQSNGILYQSGQLLNTANNNLYWLNDEDAVFAGAYNSIVYDAILDPGNYTAITLADEIEQSVSGVNRYIDGTPHQFIVTIDPQTNIVKFLSIESANLGVDPIDTTIATNIITVVQPGHSFAVGDNVTITGATSVGGIQNTVLNASHTIISTTSSTYSFRVSQVATATTSGGGANVLAGVEKPMKLLFSNVDTIGSILGFPQQDSSTQIATGIDFIDIAPPNLAITPLTSSTPGTLPARIYAKNHKLVIGDQILITNTNTIPNINGLQTVTKIISNDIFEIGKIINVVNNQTNTRNTILGTICWSLDTKYTDITTLTTRVQGNITTAIDHNYNSGDNIFIGNVIGGVTQAGTPIDGIQTVKANVTPTTFTITKGVSFVGTDIGNAYTFKTNSTSLVPINSVIPQNNGVIEPDSTNPVFVGTQVPQFVFFRNIGNVVPDLNGSVSGIHQVDYYSESTGRFDLTIPIISIFSQTASQQYIRSSDSALRTISDAFIQSNGTFRLSVPHNLDTGNRIYVRSLVPDITTSVPLITPDITGILTVNSIINSLNFDTKTSITSSEFVTGDIAYIPTRDTVTTKIQNVYPISNNYLAKNVNECRFPTCSVCADAPIVIDQSFLRLAATSNVVSAHIESVSNTSILSGVYTINQVFTSSTNFTHIFDIKNVVLDVLPLPVKSLQAAFGVGVPTTVTFYYPFSSIMLSTPTTGQVIFGGSPYLGLVPDTPYNFSYNSTLQTKSQIVITTPTDNFITPFIVSPAIGTCYIKHMTFDTGMNVGNPYGYCYIVNSSGATQGTNGTEGSAKFTEIGNGIVNATTTYLHGLQTGDLIYILSENINNPLLPWDVNFIANPSAPGTNQTPIFEFDLTTHDVTFTETWQFPAFTPPRFTIKGNIFGTTSIFTPQSVNNSTLAGSASFGSTVTFPTNQLPAASILTYSTPSVTDVFAGDPMGRAQLVGYTGYPGYFDPASASKNFSVAFQPKIGASLLRYKTQTVNVISGNVFQLSLGTIPGKGYTGSFSYIAVCGGAVQIETYFPNSWPGMIESKNNGITTTWSSGTTSNIYIGKAVEAGTTTFPIDPFAIPEPINGYLGNVVSMTIDYDPFASPLNRNFFSSKDLQTHPIVQSELNAASAEFVNMYLPNTAEQLSTIIDITAANNGLIEQSVPHGFVGGERLYFLGNVNINNGVSNDLRDNFFEVSSIDPTNNRRFSINVPLTVIGNGNVGAIAHGNFFKTPPDEVGRNILNIYRKTNGVFYSDSPHGLSATSPQQLFITNNTMGPTYDTFAQSVAFRDPEPIPNTLEFDSDIVITPNDIGIALDNNKVDIVNTNNPLFPKLNGMSWVRAPFTQKIPISNIYRDSSGTLAPVSTALSVGDIVYVKSVQPTTQDLNGFHTVSYIDLASRAYFELANVTITNTGGTIDSGNIVYFRTPSANACVNINDITQIGCPTTITATAHNFPVDSNISVFIADTQTINPIDYGNVNIINNAFVKDANEIVLPQFNNGNISANLCVTQVLNYENLFISPQGQFSKQILSTNCGTAILTPVPIENKTIITTTSRTNLQHALMFSIIKSQPIGAGASLITVQLSQGYTSLPWSNGNIVQISGHIGGDPYIDGQYKIFQVGVDTFKIVPRPPTTFLSTGGIGGFVTGPASPTVPGHGLYTGDSVMFEDVISQPVINGKIYTVDVIDSNTFSIPVVVTSYDNSNPGMWCSDLINMEIVDHGLKDGDIFFLYGAQCIGGVKPMNLNTVHGEKRKNIATQVEKETQKTVRVIDGNNIQFQTSYQSFPSARRLGGGYSICISSNNATNAEKLLGYKNYGFKAVQTNTDCLGQNTQFINLNNIDYVLLVSDVLNHMLTTGPVGECFAKIQLSEPSGQVCFNTYVTNDQVFDTPEARLDQIDLAVYRPDGKPFDLRGRNYSVTLQIEEYQDRLRNVEISSRRGIPDRGLISQIGAIESTISAENPDQNIISPKTLLGVTELTQRVNVQNIPTSFQ